MMLQQITMPKLGESVTEGKIERWLVKAGDVVNKYDALAEVTTDKVSAEIPSSFSGVITELVASEGDVLPVGALVCVMETEEANVSTVPTQQKVVNEPEPIQREKQAERLVTKQVGRYSPAVLNLASKHQIDLTQLTGTGAEGRITRKDVEAYVASGQQEAKVVEKSPVQEEMTKVSLATGDIEIPVTSVRNAIAKNMLRSTTEIPHAWTMIEVDVTELVAYREQLKDDFKRREGFNLTYFAFFLKAVAQGLKKYPMMNSVWAGEHIIQKKDINLSIAVATDDALFVPVIRNADEKSVKGIAKEIAELSNIVREGKLKAEHMQGGTFTVNNTGSFGSVQSMGIINYPQAAILQFEKIVKKPVIVQQNMIAPRDILNLCLSLDHRILDGVICGKFLQYVKEILENSNYNEKSVY
ncbi:MAG: dihydrolipoamide acetyltransferase family protein [Solibacillus sp.]